MGSVYLNGEILPLEQARVSVLDRGFLFGDGVYEVIPAYGGRPLRLAQHLDRLDRSLAAIRLTNPFPRRDWSDLVHRMLEELGTADQYVYLQVTRGVVPERDHLCPEGVTPTVFLMTKPIKPRDPAVSERGVGAATCEDLRWLMCDVKAIALLANVLFRRQAADAGALEAILVRDGLAVEGAVSNLFVVRDGVLVTPPKSRYLLPGITRDLVLELACAEGIPAREADIPREDLFRAEEVWLSSSTREVLPVTRIDGQAVGDGSPGPLWHRMSTIYQDYKQRLRCGELADA